MHGIGGSFEIINGERVRREEPGAESPAEAPASTPRRKGKSEAKPEPAPEPAPGAAPTDHDETDKDAGDAGKE